MFELNNECEVLSTESVHKLNCAIIIKKLNCAINIKNNNY